MLISGQKSYSVFNISRPASHQQTLMNTQLAPSVPLYLDTAFCLTAQCLLRNGIRFAPSLTGSAPRLRSSLHSRVGSFLAAFVHFRPAQGIPIFLSVLAIRTTAATVLRATLSGRDVFQLPPALHWAHGGVFTLVSNDEWVCDDLSPVGSFWAWDDHRFWTLDVAIGT